MKRAILAVLGAGLACVTSATPVAAATPVSVVYTDDYLELAYAPGRVVVAEREPSGAKAIVVRELRLSDRSQRVLTEIAFEGGPPDVTLAANGGGYVIGVRGRSDQVILGGYDGSRRTVVDCVSPGTEDLPRLLVAAGSTGYAFAGAACGPAGIAAVAPDGTVTPLGGDGPAPLSAGLSYAEPYLAVPLTDSVRVIDVTTGAERRLPPGYGSDTTAVAVLADGTLVFDTAPPGRAQAAGVYVWPAGAVQPRLVTGGGSRFAVRAADGQIVFAAYPSPLAAALGGGSARPLGAAGTGFPELLDFDGTHVALAGYSCQDERQVTVLDLGEALHDGAADGCPVRFSQARARFGPSGRARVRMECANGCVADLSLVEQSTERRPCADAGQDTAERECRTLATAHLRLPASKRVRTVTLRLTAAGRHLRRSRSRIDVWTALDAGRGLNPHGEIRTAVL